MTCTNPYVTQQLASQRVLGGSRLRWGRCLVRERLQRDKEFSLRRHRKIHGAIRKKQNGMVLLGTTPQRKLTRKEKGVAAAAVRLPGVVGAEGGDDEAVFVAAALARYRRQHQRHGLAGAQQRGARASRMFGPLGRARHCLFLFVVIYV